MTVVGDDQIVLYDDSNVIIGRNGVVNANTGDTDSSGLNVVDAVGSIVRSGNSGDGEGDSDDDDDEDEDDGGEVGATAVANDDTTAGSDTASSASTAERVRHHRRKAADDDVGGTQDDADDDEVGAPSGGVQGPVGASWASVDDEDVSTSASGDGVMVIGGDGYDDLAIRSIGNRNIVVYDDSNLLLGGDGPANLQIGDSDTGGAVVMGVRDSLIEAGCEGDLCPLYARNP